MSDVSCSKVYDSYDCQGMEDYYSAFYSKAYSCEYTYEKCCCQAAQEDDIVSKYINTIIIVSVVAGVIGTAIAIIVPCIKCYTARKHAAAAAAAAKVVQIVPANTVFQSVNQGNDGVVIDLGNKSNQPAASKQNIQPPVQQPVYKQPQQPQQQPAFQQQNQFANQQSYGVPAYQNQYGAQQQTYSSANFF